MKKLQKNDLKEGEIYKQLDYNYIFLYNKNETSNNFNDGTAISTTAPRYCKRWTANGFEKDMIEATPEEKHWLETCIKADQFVSYEEAMRTFIPEYVECIKTVTGITIGKILSVENNIIIDGTFNNYSIKANDIYNYFKPSTKEAYEAQFVVKEPEFVLPEKWYVKDISEHEIDIVCEYGNKMWSTPNYDCKTWKPSTLTKMLIGNYDHAGRPYFVNKDFSHKHIEITFDQFKQYVLKENTTVTEKPKVIFEEPKDKVLLSSSEPYLNAPFNIIKVQCSEGGIYKIGDKITVFDKTSPNKGKPFTIKSFRWNNAKTKICAITELHTPNGIDLDKIELYVEPKFWQEVVEKDYEILSYISKLKNCIIEPKNPLFNNGAWDIHSIKRLSDGEVFTIGDIVESGCGKQKILKIEIEKFIKYDKVWLHYQSNKKSHQIYTYTLEKIKHIKQPLFTTEDGVDIFEGDEYFELITPDFHNKPCIWNILSDKTRSNINYDQKSNKEHGRIWFSSKEKADEYILMNKPCLSLNDIEKVFKIRRTTHTALKELKELANTKING